MKEYFDYIIVGSGVAGNICAYELQKKGWSCLILEKTQGRCEKICGGGIPYKALVGLNNIGMKLDGLLHKDIALIKGDIAYINDNIEENNYAEGNEAIGCRRAIFDDFLLSEALKKGAEIQWGVSVKNIKFDGTDYSVCDFYARKVVIASGARGLQNKYYPGQSMGISAQIKGDSSYRLDCFTYFYLNESRDCYFWIFPIGQKIWNIGLWYRVPNYSMRETFNKCWNKYVVSNFRIDVLLQAPKAEFCGNEPLENKEMVLCDSIGDYAGTNNILNGGGIYRALKSTLRYTDRIDYK